MLKSHMWFLLSYLQNVVQADVIFLGIQPPGDEAAKQTYQRLTDLLSDMSTTILVHSSGEADVFA
ncbi:MAG: hypothetical protein JXM79_02650 [Sedimentisphaerales bacterium]|nr:hypothetical protein [Sedimentisphaerales bacterium]